MAEQLLPRTTQHQHARIDFCQGNPLHGRAHALSYTCIYSCIYFYMLFLHSTLDSYAVKTTMPTICLTALLFLCSVVVARATSGLHRSSRHQRQPCCQNQRGRSRGARIVRDCIVRDALFGTALFGTVLFGTLPPQFRCALSPVGLRHRRT